jgi:hypothetical protein
MMIPIVASGRRNKEENLSMPALMRGMLADEAEVYCSSKEYSVADAKALAVPVDLCGTQVSNLEELQKVFQCGFLPESLRDAAATAFIENAGAILDRHAADFEVTACVLQGLGFLGGLPKTGERCAALHDRVALAMAAFHKAEPALDVASDMNRVLFAGAAYMSNCCGFLPGAVMARHRSTMDGVARRIAKDFLHDPFSALVTVLYWGFLAKDALGREDREVLAAVFSVRDIIAALWDAHQLERSFRDVGTSYVVQFFGCLVASALLPMESVPGPIRSIMTMGK